MRQALRHAGRGILRKGTSSAKFGSYIVCTDWSLCVERYSAGSNLLQGLRGAAKVVHEELRRTSVQDRVPNVSQGLQEVSEAKLSGAFILRFTPVLAGIGSLIALDARSVSAEKLRTLSGKEIRAAFVGMQLTDEVHYRLVYERDGTLRSFSLGVKKRGKWTIDKNKLCLYLQERDDGCYDVTLSGKMLTLTPDGLGSPMDGILQPISDPQ
ncbi:MAG: hypothetical protein H8K06_20790 [Nitrospira sp.]|nr:hypothetical protein [Nitrospira sp.]